MLARVEMKGAAKTKKYEYVAIVDACEFLSATEVVIIAEFFLRRSTSARVVLLIRIISSPLYFALLLLPLPPVVMLILDSSQVENSFICYIAVLTFTIATGTTAIRQHQECVYRNRNRVYCRRIGSCDFLNRFMS